MEQTTKKCTDDDRQGDGHPVVAALLDLVMWPLRATRAELVPQARGRVLEVGVGTGANLEFYGDVESVTGVDPDPHMLKRATARAKSVNLSIRLVQEGAEHLRFEDNSFDTVVATWVLCSVDDPTRALAEMKRVLVPNGRLLFAEHTRSRYPCVARLQTWLTPIWKRMAGGCHLDRESIALIRRAGFANVSVEASGTEAWTLAPVYRGTGIG